MVGFFQILAGLKDVRRHLTFDSFREEYGSHLSEQLQKKGVKPRSSIFRVISIVALLVLFPYYPSFWIHVLSTTAIVIQSIVVITETKDVLQAMVLADHQTMKILRDKYNKTVSRVPSTPRRRS